MPTPFEVSVGQVRQLTQGNIVHLQIQSDERSKKIRLKVHDSMTLTLAPDEARDLAAALKMSTSVKNALRVIENEVIQNHDGLRQTVVGMLWEFE